MKLPQWAQDIRDRLNPSVAIEELERKIAIDRYYAAAVEEKASSEKASEVIDKLLEQMRDDRDGSA